jgi:DNA-binding SARP family transcriptional activator/Tfp pilus assembly protein PilF
VGGEHYITILGPLAVYRRGEPVTLGGPGQRTLLSLLALSAGRPVQRGAIAQVLWPRDPPAAAVPIIQSYVSRLRRALDPGAEPRSRNGLLASDMGGYRLKLTTDELDLLSFRAFIEAAKQAQQAGELVTAMSAFERALGLWQGEALADIDVLRGHPALVAVADEQAAAVLDYADAAADCGRPEAVLPHLRALVARNPLDEASQSRLMIALSGCGRQAEALAAYEDLRRRLDEELGVLPGAVLRDAHARVLRQETGQREIGQELGQYGGSGCGAVAWVPRQLPATVPLFVGRDGEVGVLDRLRTRANGGMMVISAIGGTAGVGKTALAVHWAHRVAGEYPDGQLYANLRGYDVDEPVPAADVLAGFLRALGMPAGEIPVDVDERAAAYRSLLAGRRVLVLLDNAGEVSQVRPLLPGNPACAVLVTSRDALTGLVARDGARRLDLDLLSPDGAAGLLRELIGERAGADAAATEALAERCSRLPLALRIAAEHVAANPGVPVADLVEELTGRRRLDVMEAGGDAGTSVRTVFSWSRGPLDPATDRAFRLIGLHPGPDLDKYAVAALTGATPAQASEMLGRLAGAHLLQRVRAGRYGMHDLLRDYARELVAEYDGQAGERAAMTRLLDFYLCTCAAAMDAIFPAESHRRPRLPEPGPGVPVLGFDVRGREAATEWLDAERTSLVAISVRAASGGWPAHACQLSATITRYLASRGHFVEAASVHRHAVRAACENGDPNAEAGALNSLGVIEWLWGQNKEATAHWERAMALSRACGNRQQEARALGNLGVMAFREAQFDQAIKQLRESLELWRELGDLVGQATNLNNLGALELCRGRMESAAVLFRESLAISRLAGDAEAEADALTDVGALACKQQRYEEAEDCQRRALAIFRARGLISGEANALVRLAELQIATGRPEQAIAQLRGALRLASSVDNLEMRARVKDRMGRAHQAAGNLAEARVYWQEALDIFVMLGSPEAAGEVRGLLAVYFSDTSPSR